MGSQAHHPRFRGILLGLLDRLLDLLPADRGFIAPVENGLPLLERAVHRVRSAEESAGTGPTPGFSRTVLEGAMQRAGPVFYGVQGEQCLEASDSIRESRLTAALASALVADRRVLGVLYVDARGGTARFTPESRQLFEWIVALAGLALEVSQAGAASGGPPAFTAEWPLRRLAHGSPTGLVLLRRGEVACANETARRLLGPLPAASPVDPDRSSPPGDGGPIWDPADLLRHLGEAPPGQEGFYRTGTAHIGARVDPCGDDTLAVTLWEVGDPAEAPSLDRLARDLVQEFSDALPAMLGTVDTALEAVPPGPLHESLLTLRRVARRAGQVVEGVRGLMEAPRAPASRAPARILVVDDDARIRRLTCSYFQRIGYRTLTAPDGARALDDVRARPGEVDAVILDLDMPVMGGRACLGILRAESPQLPVIIASGEATDLLAEELLRDGAFRVLAKPFDLATLARMVQEALQRPDAPPAPS